MRIQSDNGPEYISLLLKNWVAQYCALSQSNTYVGLYHLTVHNEWFICNDLGLKITSARIINWAGLRQKISIICLPDLFF